MEEIKMEDEHLTYVALENVQFNNLSFEVAHQEQINELCRTCLSSSTSFQSLFETDLDKMVMGFTSVQFTQGDGLPSKICSDCVLQIKQAYIFKQQVEHSDNILKQHCLYIEREQNADKPKNKYSKVDHQQPTNITSFKTECVQSITTWLDSNDEVMHYISDDSCYDDDVRENIDTIESNECSNTTEAEEDTFRNEENLKRNDKMKNASAEDHECSTCGEKSTCASALKVHMRSHIDRPYKCHVTNCGKAFVRPNLLNSHLRKHIGVQTEHITKSRNHVCSMCGKAFYGAVAFTTHMRSHTQKPFQYNNQSERASRNIYCFICGMRWSGLRNLKLHMKIHNNERSYKCDFTNCGKSFKSIGDFVGHKWVHAENEEMKDASTNNYICPICGKKSISLSALKRHTLTHADKKPYHCAQCGKNYKSKCNLRGHESLLTEHRTRKYHCSICGKKWIKRSDLTLHMKVHRQRRRPYKCDRSTRKYHCSICGKEWIKRSDLTLHMKVHRQRPYKCDFLNCSTTFKYLRNLNEHKRYVH